MKLFKQFCIGCMLNENILTILKVNKVNKISSYKQRSVFRLDGTDLCYGYTQTYI